MAEAGTNSVQTCRLARSVLVKRKNLNLILISQPPVLASPTGAKLMRRDFARLITTGRRDDPLLKWREQAGRDRQFGNWGPKYACNQTAGVVAQCIVMPHLTARELAPSPFAE